MNSVVLCKEIEMQTKDFRHQPVHGNSLSTCIPARRLYKKSHNFIGMLFYSLALARSPVHVHAIVEIGCVAI